MSYDQKTPEQRIAEQLQERRQYNVLAAINIFFALGFFVFLIWAIIDVFMAQWAHATGFGILTVIFGYIFRRIPWPETKLEKAIRQLRSYQR